MDAFLTGVVAGYGIAIPVGAIAILIVEVGLKHGFRPAFFAGAGAATADLLYAGLAVVGGVTLAGAVETIDDPLRIASGAILILIAILGLRRVGQEVEPVEEPAYPSRNELIGTYARFLGLTIINPTTIVYFAAVVIGLGVVNEMTPAQGVTFAAGAFLASLSWQTTIAAAASSARHRLSPRARTAAIVTGNLVILAFAILILI